MEKITFDELVSKSPRIIQKKLYQLMFLRERPDFHPEPSVYHHIKIVTNRIINKGYGIDLILSGLLHDICKYDNVKPSRTGYPTSPTHDKDAAKFIKETERVIDFITLMGGDVDKVAMICENHMRMNVYKSMKPSKKKKMEELYVFDELKLFFECDKMTNPEYNMEDVLPYSILLERMDNDQIKYSANFKGNMGEEITKRVFHTYLQLGIATDQYYYEYSTMSPDFLDIYELKIKPQ